MDLREIALKSVHRIHLAQNRNLRRAVVNTVMNLRVPQNVVYFLTALDCFSRRILLHGVRQSKVLKMKMLDRSDVESDVTVHVSKRKQKTALRPITRDIGGQRSSKAVRVCVGGGGRLGCDLTVLHLYKLRYDLRL
jgi:hypothetical protein